ncbi:MAG: winged helix-turn-helix domain-containing protein, partial [Terracidiphilus sp.]
MAPKPCPDLVRFGIFEVDFRAGELRKQGRKVRLQDLPFQFLTVLLEHPGQVVTRDELVRRLWSEHAMIDVDNGLNTAAKKLRLALGDNAETPRFIETLPRRGYRFIGVIQVVQPVEPADGPAVPPTVDDPPPDAPHSPAAPTKLEPMQLRPSRRAWLAVPGVILLSLAAVRLLAPSRSPATLRTVQLTHTGSVEPFNGILTDGTRIYFNERSGGKWPVSQVSVEGGTPSPFRTPPGQAELRAISPNRSELLVSIAQNNEEDAPLWIIPTVAGSPRRLGSVLAHTAIWSRDGRTIIYGFGPALFRVNGDGTNPRKLTDLPGVPFFVRSSPAGQPEILRFTIVGPLYAVWECFADGSGLRRFAPANSWAETARGALSAGWTPDGKYFLFQSRNDHGTGIWAVREGRDLFHPFDRRAFQLYSTPTDLGVSIVSADAKRLFFAIGQERRDLVSYDAKRKQFLPFLSGAAVRGVTFSTDAQWVAYETIPEGTLWRSRADGSERLQLTSQPLRISEPRWSPDGRRIAFTGARTGTEDHKVYVVPADGGSMEALRTDPYRASGPSWSSDGQALMFGCW